jgi:hypothetical protein
MAQSTESTLKKMFKETMSNYSSTIPQQQNSMNNDKSELLNILHDGLTDQQCLSKSIAIQCSSNDFTQDINHSYRSLIGHLSSSITDNSPSIPPPPGYYERGIQVDFNEIDIDSLGNLIEFYSDRLSSDIIKQFYELCNSDIQWTRIHIDEYLQHSHIVSSIPTLRQLSLNALIQWNEQIKSSNPSFDTISVGDLLQDINDEQVFEEYISDDTNNQLIEFSDGKQMTIPWSLINSLQELYGELPTKSTLSYTSDGLVLPLDDELSMNIYQALQRFLGVSNKIIKPVNEKKLIKENKKPNKQQQQQQWVSPLKNDSNKKSTGPNLQDIMNEELRSMNAQKQTQKRQLDFASQHKLKNLERQFSSIDPDVLYDMFIDNESDYDLAFACISSMLEENASISKSKPIPSSSNTHSMITRQSLNESDINSFEISRRHAHDYALKRKECYNKADHANRHGMTGVASYYINQAREQTQLMKEANRQACEYLFQTRMIQFRQTHQLDLHELHADEALQLFKQVEQELNNGNRRTTPKSIEIITGYGKNSPYGGGSGKIRSTILNYLRQRNYKYSEPNKGAILVHL